MRWLAPAFAALCLAGAARADDGLLTGTLKAVQDRGTILIGTRESVIPFSFLNRGGQHVGFSVDLCHSIAADVAAAMHQDLLEPDAARQPGIRIVYVPVVAEARLPKVIAGEVDLECGSTTATDERAKTVAFSPVFFLAGTKLMVLASSSIAAYPGTAGRTIVVSAGTTNAAIIKRLAARVTPPPRIVEVPDVAAAFGQLAAGKADAFAADDILLAGLLATAPDRERFKVVGEYLSYEPYAIMFRRDDPDLAALVQQSFARLASDGTLGALYRRWFTNRLPNGENLRLPMSPHLAEMYRALGEPD